MVWSAITKQKDVRDLMLAQEVIEETRPVSEPPAEISCTIRPVDLITSTDIDPLNFQATLAHRRAKLMQHRTGRTLKK
jgi:hypothetical protein